VQAEDDVVSYDDLIEVADGVIVRPMLSIDDAIDRYLGDLARRGKSERTRDTYSRTLYDFCDTLPNHWDVAKVTDDDVRRFLDRYNRHSPAYRAQKDSILRGFFRWLYVTEKIKRSPLERMLPPKRQNPEDVDVTSVSTEQVRELLAACDGWTERLTLGLLAYTGARRHATSALRLSDYDRVGRRLRFHEKGAKTIWKPVPHELGQLLDAAIAAGVYADDVAYLIPSIATPRRGDRDDRIVWRTVKRVADRCGIDCHTHALRAAFAVFFDKHHPDQATTLKDLLGHARIETTMVYLRRRNRDAGMETIRDLSWAGNTAAPESPQTAETPLEALLEAEKEGFEPSMEAFTPITP
jgi:integrase